ncbi:YidB family protein [Streptomyces sp. SYSU K217416]
MSNSSVKAITEGRTNVANISSWLDNPMYDHLKPLLNPSELVKDLTHIPAYGKLFGKHGTLSSWVAKGPNKPISAQEISEAMPGLVNAVSAKTGQDTQRTAQELSEGLPDLIDNMTPNGSWEDDENDDE